MMYKVTGTITLRKWWSKKTVKLTVCADVTAKDEQEAKAELDRMVAAAHNHRLTGWGPFTAKEDLPPMGIGVSREYQNLP